MPRQEEPRRKPLRPRLAATRHVHTYTRGHTQTSVTPHAGDLLAGEVGPPACSRSRVLFIYITPYHRERRARDDRAEQLPEGGLGGAAIYTCASPLVTGVGVRACMCPSTMVDCTLLLNVPFTKPSARQRNAAREAGSDVSFDTHSTGAAQLGRRPQKTRSQVGALEEGAPLHQCPYTPRDARTQPHCQPSTMCVGKQSNNTREKEKKVKTHESHKRRKK